MCAQPFCNVREIGTEYDNSEDEDEEAQYNIWNKMLELFTQHGDCPVLQYQLEDWETCRVALSCHFALDIVFAFTA